MQPLNTPTPTRLTIVLPVALCLAAALVGPFTARVYAQPADHAAWVAQLASDELDATWGHIRALDAPGLDTTQDPAQDAAQEPAQDPVQDPAQDAAQDAYNPLCIPEGPRGKELVRAWLTFLSKEFARPANAGLTREQFLTAQRRLAWVATRFESDNPVAPIMLRTVAQRIMLVNAVRYAAHHPKTPRGVSGDASFDTIKPFSRDELRGVIRKLFPEEAEAIYLEALEAKDADLRRAFEDAGRRVQGKETVLAQLYTSKIIEQRDVHGLFNALLYTELVRAREVPVFIDYLDHTKQPLSFDTFDARVVVPKLMAMNKKWSYPYGLGQPYNGIARTLAWGLDDPRSNSPLHYAFE